MTTPNSACQQLLAELREISLLGSAASVLGWDEHTYMPPKGANHRAEQSSLLARIIHERFVSPRVGDLLSQAESDLAASATQQPSDGEIAANLRETRRSYDRAVKLPSSLVEELARTCVLGQQAWAEARKNSDFPQFAPWLEKIVGLKRQEAACIGSKSGNPYDALLDEYEPDETAEGIRNVFGSLREPLQELVGQIMDSVKKAPVEILHRHYPAAAQEALSRKAASAFGFDFDAGRLDISVHPFCSGLGPGDTRLTTRYDENYFGDAFFGVLHETGHGLYDQGLPEDKYGTPCGDAISLGIHESQSRFWENFVGRSQAFWSYMFPHAREAFPDALKGVGESDWMFAINSVEPSFIRVESDEATYNLHILLRFELELALMNGDLKPADVPGAWNEKMKTYLRITPKNDAQGCLQDIHWSGGGIGYFPTYTLGNLIAAQLYEAAKSAMPNLEDRIAAGDFAELLQWLRENIHRHGKRYSPRELVTKATGKPLSAEPLLRHLRAKAQRNYGV